MDVKAAAKNVADKAKARFEEVAATPKRSYEQIIFAVDATMAPVVASLYFLHGLFMVLMMLAAISGNTAVAVASGCLFLGGLMQKIAVVNRIKSEKSGAAGTLE